MAWHAPLRVCEASVPSATTLVYRDSRSSHMTKSMQKAPPVYKDLLNMELPSLGDSDASSSGARLAAVYSWLLSVKNWMVDETTGRTGTPNEAAQRVANRMRLPKWTFSWTTLYLYSRATQGDALASWRHTCKHSILQLFDITSCVHHTTHNM